MRGEFEWAEVPYPVRTQGTAESLPVTEDDHEDHAFLYIPDLSAQTGWTAHRVPQTKATPRSDRRPMGFRR